MSGASYVTKQAPVALGDAANQPDVFSINIADYNSSSTLYNVNSLSELKTPGVFGKQPIKIMPVKAAQSEFKFNRRYLLVPLLAFTVVAIVAIICGTVFGIMSQSNLSKISDVAVKASADTNTLPPVPAATFNATKAIKENNSGTNSCGVQTIKPNLNQLRIIRGYDSVPHSWPWAVSIGYQGQKGIIGHACGGTLINKRNIITATHCVEPASVYSLVGSPNSQYTSVASMMRVYVGVSRRSTDENSSNTFGVVKILQYPDFDPNSFKNDITILTLDRDVEVSDNVGFICLDQHTNINPGIQVYAVGWGFTEKNWFKANDDLMQVSFQIQSSQTCGLSYIPVFQFCAGDHTLGKDTCNGDSGGPIMSYVDNRFVLAGIVSNGDSACTGRGIYTNVNIYYDWILQNSYSN